MHVGGTRCIERAGTGSKLLGCCQSLVNSHNLGINALRAQREH